VEKGAHPARMTVSVPKKIFRRAVDRNLLKRRIREAYRKIKPSFYRELARNSVFLEMVVQYRDKVPSDYHKIETSLQYALDKLITSGGKGFNG
jgi:ribonuclease P protein component